MFKVYLLRIIESDEGTFGKLIFEDLRFECFSGEQPDRDNKRNISRIPSGEYLCKVRYSPHFKRLLYEVTDVKDRSNILIHPGNYCGDRDKGYRSDLRGCIALGKHFGELNGQKAILISKVAVNEFMDLLDYKPFKLIIIDAGTRKNAGEM
jgi:hypothetical protein